MGPSRMLIVPSLLEWFQPFWEPGSAWRSRLMQRPYLRAHLMAFKKYLRIYSLVQCDGVWNKRLHVRPRGLRKEQFVLTYFDGPVSDQNANKVESCRGNIGEVLLGLCSALLVDEGRNHHVRTHNEHLVMVFEFVDGAIRIHQHGEIPLVHGRTTRRVVVLLVKCRNTTNSIIQARNQFARW